MEFGLKLQGLRKEKGLSQEALAEMLNVSRQAVSKWETGEGYPEMEKLLLISDLFQISLDYLMKDSVDESFEDSKTDKRFINHSRIEEYIKFKKSFALRIAFAVACIILSVNLVLLFSETKHDYMGIVSMLIVIAFAVALIIVTELSNAQYNKLEKRNIYMSFNDLQELQNQYVKFKSKFGIAIAAGVCLIIVSVAMVVFISEMVGEDSILGMVQLILCIAISVFMFIVVGIEDSMYRFLVQNDDFIDERKQKNFSLYAITMPLTTMIYLAIGFIKSWWHPGWLLFPTAAIITWTIEQFILKNDNDYN